MDDQDLVCMRHPLAEAREEPAILEHGAELPIEAGHWAIFAGPTFDLPEIGRGKSEARAWADAARKLVPTRSAGLLRSAANLVQP
jgi:uncharacterized protein YprB with RNaseH-like and TPR domain